VLLPLLLLSHACSLKLVALDERLEGCVLGARRDDEMPFLAAVDCAGEETNADHCNESKLGMLK